MARMQVTTLGVIKPISIDFTVDLHSRYNVGVLHGVNNCLDMLPWKPG